MLFQTSEIGKDTRVIIISASFLGTFLEIQCIKFYSHWWPLATNYVSLARDVFSVLNEINIILLLSALDLCSNEKSNVWWAQSSLSISFAVLKFLWWNYNVILESIIFFNPSFIFEYLSDWALCQSKSWLSKCCTKPGLLFPLLEKKQTLAVTILIL